MDCCANGPMGEARRGPLRVDFDRRLKLEEVCPDDKKQNHQRHETAVVVGPGTKRSALPSTIGLHIAVESPNVCSHGQNRLLSEEDRSRSTDQLQLSSVSQAAPGSPGLG